MQRHKIDGGSAADLQVVSADGIDHSLQHLAVGSAEHPAFASAFAEPAQRGADRQPGDDGIRAVSDPAHAQMVDPSQVHQRPWGAGHPSAQQHPLLPHCIDDAVEPCARDMHLDRSADSTGEPVGETVIGELSCDKIPELTHPLMGGAPLFLSGEVGEERLDAIGT